MDRVIVQAAAIGHFFTTCYRGCQFMGDPFIISVTIASHAAGPIRALQVQMYLLWTIGLPMSMKTAQSLRRLANTMALVKSTFCFVTATSST